MPSLIVTLLIAAMYMVAFAVLGLAIAYGLIKLVRQIENRHPNPVRRAALKRLVGPSRIALPLLSMAAGVHLISLPAVVKSELEHGVELGLDAVAAWVLARLLEAVEDAILYHYNIDSSNNLKARRLQTQLRVFRRVVVAIVAIIAIAVALFSFPSVRLAGAGLLASAGIVSIIVGVASKPVTSNILAGLQIALSQPIRLDDVVVVEGHWGRIEEIGLTYVIVRDWDLRRLVLPISYFIENPFENWTKMTADILGYVHMEVDYRAPVQEIRTEFLRILADSPDWDGKVATCQVTNLGVSTMQIRLLMSSPDSSRSWNLQCEVREKIISFLQQHYPDALPRVRAEISPEMGKPNGKLDTASLRDPKHGSLS
jgi:small-conductance mechanosensitive channel